MASAFASGFRMGGDMFDSAERNRLMRERLELEKAQEARNAEEQGLRIAAARRVNDATDELTRAQSLGIALPENQMANEGLQRQSFRQFEIGQQNAEAAGTPDQAPAYVAPTGLQPAYRKASDLDMNAMLARLAAAKGDNEGLRNLRLDRKGIEYDEGYKKYLEDWNKMDDGAKGDLINSLSLDANVKGFGSWVPGKGKQQGYMNYLPPGGDPIRLSSNEARDLYVLSSLMQVDPLRARAEMEKVSDKVRAVASQAFDAQSKGVGVNNQATRYANADANDEARLNAQREYYAYLRSRADRTAAQQDAAEAHQAKIDGVLEGYQAARAAGPQGAQAAAIYAREYDQLRATAPRGLRVPSLNALNDAQKAPKDEKPVEVKEEGTRVTLGGKLHFADGMGGYIPANSSGRPAGILPSQRNAVLKQAGVPDNLIGELPWSRDGSSVGYRGREYNASNRDDLKQLIEDARTLPANDRLVDEEYKYAESVAREAARMRELANREAPVGRGIGPRITYRPDPVAPHPGAGPAAWEAYRRIQKERSQ